MTCFSLYNFLVLPLRSQPYSNTRKGERKQGSLKVKALTLIPFLCFFTWITVSWVSLKSEKEWDNKNKCERERAIKRKSQTMKLRFLEADSHHEPLHWKSSIAPITQILTHDEILFTAHERTYVCEIKSYVLQDVNWLRGGNKATTELLMKIL